MARVLVVDDDGHIREVVRFALEQAGHEVTEAADGLAACAAFDGGAFELLVLDILMPERDGLEVCRHVRSKARTPIIFLSSRDEDLDRVLGLELGADDYLTKPFSVRELVARTKAVLRRVNAPEPAATEPAALLSHGALAMDLGRHRCTYGDDEVSLTVTELELLRCLLGRPGQVHSRDELVRQAYGEGHFITERTVDSHVRCIRKKLAAAGADPVETVYGVGYRLREPV